ncbi:MAG: TPM domain-containing protein [Bacteroidales bacterium]|nr:TPM domain-containing protein [Bacteroidales bacterium]MCF8349533.1 TPM domain-containing protein [Bacteroidales bacterium]MCF8375092.1 TPM domain-containing protein [Bacteroidales bacterium]MCF8399999.1 TPM domain-containing protein [Bacteroidales bacterium]
MGTTARNFFSRQEKAELKQAILTAELDTSGEIRLHIENHCKGEVMDRAADVFAMLKMHKTDLRNGVLFYLAVKDRKYAIIGDKGINQVVPDNFWNEIKEEMGNTFKEGNFAEGLINGIHQAGKHLKKHFPHQTDDINELSDEISFGAE